MMQIMPETKQKGKTQEEDVISLVKTWYLGQAKNK